MRVGRRVKNAFFENARSVKKKISVRNFEDFQKSPRLIVRNIYLHKQTRRFLKILKIVGADFFLTKRGIFSSILEFSKEFIFKYVILTSYLPQFEVFRKIIIISY